MSSFSFLNTSNRHLKSADLFESQNNIHNSAEIFIKDLRKSHKSNEELYREIEKFNSYNQPNRTGLDWLFSIETNDFGKVPFRVYIPLGYNANKSYPLIVYLHGAATQVTHDMIKEDFMKGDSVLGRLKKQNKYLILMPIADKRKSFNWAFNIKTFSVLSNQITIVKQKFNVEDSKVFVYGHSDGGRGAFSYLAINPSVFAGAVCYNMGPGLIFDDIYTNNILNRPIYVVQSDLDDINPYQDAQNAIKLLKNSGGIVHYQLYHGFRHYDKHLSIDFKQSVQFLGEVKRSSYSNKVIWQTNSELTGCDGIIISKLNLLEQPKTWHIKPNFKYYNKAEKKYSNTYFYNQELGGEIKSTYKNNIFTIITSRVSQFKILINPRMVDLSKPISIVCNGKVLYHRKVGYDKSFLIDNFQKNFDRQNIWINNLTINVAH